MPIRAYKDVFTACFELKFILYKALGSNPFLLLTVFIFLILQIYRI